MSDSSLPSQPDNVPPAPPRKERRAGAALTSAPDSNRFSGLDIAVVALLIVSLIVSVTIIPTRGFSHIFSVGWDLLLWYLPERLLFAPVWVNIVAVVMYVRRRDQAGIVASWCLLQHIVYRFWMTLFRRLLWWLWLCFRLLPL